MLLVVGYAALVAVRELDLLFGMTGLGQLRNTLQPYVDLLAASDERGIVGLLRDNLSQVRRYTTTAFTWFMRSSSS